MKFLTPNDFTERFKRFDIGVTAGAGVEIPVKENWTIFFEVRNNLGLYNTSDLPVVNDGTIKTNSTNLLAGFSYQFGKRELKGAQENE